MAGRLWFGRPNNSSENRNLCVIWTCHSNGNVKALGFWISCWKCIQYIGIDILTREKNAGDCKTIMNKFVKFEKLSFQKKISPCIWKAKNFPISLKGQNIYIIYVAQCYQRYSKLWNLEIVFWKEVHKSFWSMYNIWDFFHYSSQHPTPCTNKAVNLLLLVEGALTMNELI